MSLKHFDVIVVGLGAFGSAVTLHCAKRGLKTLGIDRYSPPHHFGSSHGESRVTRLNAMEGDEYVGLVKRSHQLWRELEKDSGSKIMELVGGLVIESGAPTSAHGISDMMQQVEAVAVKHGIAHELLGANEIRARYPQFNVPESARAYFEPSAGYIRPEVAISAELEQAKKYGAELVFGKKVVEWTRDAPNSVCVKTEKETFGANRLVLTAGPWMSELVKAHLQSKLKVYRQVLYWFKPKTDLQNFSGEKLPIFVWLKGGTELFYGFPIVESGAQGVKLATEEFIETTEPDLMNREVSAAEKHNFYKQYLQDGMPGLSPECIKASACMYTMAPKSKFIIDFVPDFPEAIMISACSGHGFKHSPAVGEAVAELIATNHASIDLSPFRLAT